MRLAREGRDHFTDDRHRRQDHDVHGRMRIEPEQVLEQDRIAAEGRIEDTDTRNALEDQQQQGDRQHGRRQDDDQRVAYIAPDEQRHPNHVMPGARILWIVTMKLIAVNIDEKPTITPPSTVPITCVFEYVVL